jgi:hypothetical protein
MGGGMGAFNASNTTNVEGEAQHGDANDVIGGNEA